MTCVDHARIADILLCQPAERAHTAILNKYGITWREDDSGTMRMVVPDTMTSEELEAAIEEADIAHAKALDDQALIHRANAEANTYLLPTVEQRQ